MEFCILLLFILALMLCILFRVSILCALAVGYLLFFCWGLHKKISVKTLLHLSVQGIYTVRNVLITFFLIGMLTGLWRASGTIAAIICGTAGFVSPKLFLLLTFLLNSLVSFLTGTSFGTAATMGAVCMSMGLTLGVDPALLGGAILSGSYFGDRSSPVSTSALLVSELTHTDIFENLHAMFKTAAVPFFLSALLYLLLGFLFPCGDRLLQSPSTWFAREFSLGFFPLIPALLILLLSLFRIDVKKIMIASIAVAFCICLFYQKIPISELLLLLFSGYHAKNVELSSMLNGGGILSMLKVSAIVCLSSSYSGIFQATGLLMPIRDLLEKALLRISAFSVFLMVSILSGMVACNQTLTIMLTEQLCSFAEPDEKKRAMALEDSAVILAPLIPWSIAGAVPLASVGAPTCALLASCYLYLLPLWHLIQEKSRISKGRGNTASSYSAF